MSGERESVSVRVWTNALLDTTCAATTKAIDLLLLVTWTMMLIGAVTLVGGTLWKPIERGALERAEMGHWPSPYMSTWGVKPRGDDVRPFGCLAIVTKNSAVSGTKLNPRGERGIYVGTCDQEYGGDET